jgi:3-oxoadipate enol-lactonase
VAERRDEFPPDPPVELPPGRIVHLPDRGEFFVRDSGGDGPAVLLLHGWMFQSDLNWWRCYGPLADAGYRVVAIDHRGHGRGLRTPADFRLTDCADDAAAVVRALGCAPVTAVGYSMGGTIAQLLARDHRELLSGVVLSATAADWSEPRMRRFWKTMGALRLGLNLFPTGAWRGALRAAGFKPGPTTTWTAAELSRGSSRDIAEAGRELGRFDSRPWLRDVDVPAAMIVTSSDRSVPPRKQRELADLIRARRVEFEGDHSAVVYRGRTYAPLLVETVATLQGARVGARLSA